MNNQQEARNNTYRVRFTDSEVKEVISLKAETGEVIDSLATFIAKSMMKLAAKDSGNAMARGNGMNIRDSIVQNNTQPSASKNI